MNSRRWLFIGITFIAGIALGLLYGWVIDPVKFIDLTPNTLRADYKADYILMVAEAYRVEQDPGIAARRLALFGADAPAVIAASGYDFARRSGFSQSDLDTIQNLVTTLQAWQPPAGAAP